MNRVLVSMAVAIEIPKKAPNKSCTLMKLDLSALGGSETVAIALSKVEFNVPLDESIFSRPGVK